MSNMLNSGKSGENGKKRIRNKNYFRGSRAVQETDAGNESNNSWAEKRSRATQLSIRKERRAAQKIKMIQFQFSNHSVDR